MFDLQMTLIWHWSNRPLTLKPIPLIAPMWESPLYGAWQSNLLWQNSLKFTLPTLFSHYLYIWFNTLFIQDLRHDLRHFLMFHPVLQLSLLQCISIIKLLYYFHSMSDDTSSSSDYYVLLENPNKYTSSLWIWKGVSATFKVRDTPFVMKRGRHESTFLFFISVADRPIFPLSCLRTITEIPAGAPGKQQLPDVVFQYENHSLRPWTVKSAE